MSKSLEMRLAEAERVIADFAPIPNLHIDTRGRSLKLDMLHAEAPGGLKFDIESRSHMGRLPSASLAVSDRRNAAALRAELSHDLERITLGGSWNIRAASLTGAVSGDGRCEAGLSLRLTKTQSIDYSVKAGPSTDHRIGWSLRISL